MSTMVTEVYDAFLDARVPEPKARAAATAIDTHEDRFDTIEKELVTLHGEIKSIKWIVSINTGMILALLGIMFMTLKGTLALSS